MIQRTRELTYMPSDESPNQELNKFAHARNILNLSCKELADKLNSSYFALVRWERGDLTPPTEILARLSALLGSATDSRTQALREVSPVAFESRGLRKKALPLPMFDTEQVPMLPRPRSSFLSDITDGELWGNSDVALGQMLAVRNNAADTRIVALDEEISAGKNTYTYDAHTYHTKVPPQGIAHVISKYLPNGGIVLDPFAGSGMTGVAARYLGMDVILNELSPAASFIAHNFTQTVDPVAYNQAIVQVLNSLRDVRTALYSTQCRECGSTTEEHFTVWSYQLECNFCHKSFILWDHCRVYGRTVREHKLLRKFPCPHCGTEVNKSYLRRFDPVPVFLGYKCCRRVIMEHTLNACDADRITRQSDNWTLYWEHVPKTTIPEGVNLNQPRRHGFDSIYKLYTNRNLIACAAIWREIKRIEDPELASAVGFTFTSMYQRVTRLSEYRFWGGSGNTANFNVPQIFNETNVFITFERKAKSISDHYITTAENFTGRCAIRTGSATDLRFLPDNSVDLIFTDPPFGANINYSEMNILWESWLGVYTDTENEAIINRIQSKSVDDYKYLMTECLNESYRVLQPDHWMVLIFMNSSEKVWHALKSSIEDAGFVVERVNVFDKQHGTFKQFVSENTAGADLMLHCRKPKNGSTKSRDTDSRSFDVAEFIAGESTRIPIFPFLHVDRKAEVDYRTLYSRYIAEAIHNDLSVIDFAQFRKEASELLGDK